ncbi:molybdenum cofactor guanylyltransferase [Gaoshiqia sediminis]|uniref:Probable molybdenum cofactor guanylyltransferase n=1 Tax=Gaoshiqia sediminis TaxID=2986998 RepID=A0AA42C9L4_9BACT|nr:molybdenum cofactor guanylyltransferase [Gaoshiqia sediminis]MCW0482300.1 molybdenum cofactor guanylyltransferase [Gaoshiqia sediminis]
MTQNDSDITGIILAGGQSHRMGFNKALAMLDGKPLIEFVVDNLRKITQSLILSTGSEFFEYKNLQVVPDLHPGFGPLGGICSALKSSKTNLNLVLSCDMPLVSSSFLSFLAEEARRHPAPITLPVDKYGYWQPLCAVYRKDVLPALYEALSRNELKIITAIRETHPRVIQFMEWHPSFQNMSFLSINTPEALKQAESVLDIFREKRL